MSKEIFVLLIVCIFRYTTCQLPANNVELVDKADGLLRIGLRWFGQQVPVKNFIKNLENIENSVHDEKILTSQTGYIRLAAKRIFSAIDHETEDQSLEKHEKRTNLIEVAKKLNLRTFISKAKEAGIDDILDHEGKFTVFAPTDEAFARIPNFCSKINPKDLMRFHVSKGAVSSSSFKDNLILRTLLTRRGTRINVYQNNTVVTANGRRVNQTDFKASNGILHVIDDVMCAIYRGGAAYAINRCPKLTVLAKALNLTNLYSALESTKQLTVFAPSDDAFSKIPQEVLDDLLNNVTALTEVLQTHVIPGVWYSPGFVDGQILTTLSGQNLTLGVAGNITVNNARVIAPDATVKNGVVHGIDTVLLPSSYEDMPYSSKPVVFVI